MTKGRRARAIPVVLAAIIVAAPLVGSAVTICDVQEYDEMGLSPLEGQTVTVQGVVTIPPGYFQPDFSSFYIESDGCGVNLFSFDQLSIQLAVGDTVEVTGVVTEYQSSSTGAGSTTEIEFSSLTRRGVATFEPEPVYLSLDQVGLEENEGRLIRTVGVVRDEGSLYSMYIWQPWSSVEMQVYRANPNVDVQAFDVGDTLEVVGILQQYDATAPYFDGWELSPRWQSDMKLAVPPPPPDPVFWPEAALGIPARVFRPDVNEVIPISYLAPEGSTAFIEIFDLQGRRIRKLTEGEYTGYSSVPEFYKDDFFVEGLRGWDGRDDLRKIVPAGVYVCRLEVEDEDGQVSVETAPIVVGVMLTD